MQNLTKMLKKNNAKKILVKLNNHQDSEHQLNAAKHPGVASEVQTHEFPPFFGLVFYIIELI
jgi:hypothetical protein